MASSLDMITIEGFKSIQSLTGFQLGRLNLLVGANGAGKSNFVDFFRLLRAVADDRLGSFVLEHGKADTFLFNGPKVTELILAQLTFGANECGINLKATVTGELIVAAEFGAYTKGGPWDASTSDPSQSGVRGSMGLGSRTAPWAETLSKLTVYHFHDTSYTAGMRREQSLRDFRELRPDAGNVAAFLHHLKAGDQDRYEQIRYHLQLIAPFFDDFLLEPQERGPEEVIRLEWRQKGSSTPLQPHQFSDGTMRFICLATTLLQPDPPPTILIDEPELGLHPFALGVLASLLRQASSRTQIIVSTQSAPLLDTFEPEEVIIVDRVQGASRFRRLEAEPLQAWLEDYSLGQLWQKNVIEAGPVHE